MRTHTPLLLAFFLGISMLPEWANAQTDPNSSGAPSPPAADSHAPAWLFPIEKLNESLPSWLRFGGEYRDRLEGPIGVGFRGTNDFYLLDRLRVTVAIQPNDWLKFYGEVQDSRIFFNHHIANANPFEDSWTLWQGYAQVGSSTSGWLDVLAGRQVLLFGDERVIGPSNWLNVGRTFDVARVDFHHPGYEVAGFASSVVPGSNTFLHRAIPGNNFYGIYGSFQNIIPQAIFEPYVLWPLAPPNPQLPEEVGHGHLNEVTIGLHVEGTLPAGFYYDTEFDGQTGTLAVYSIGAWAGYVGGGKAFPSVATAPRVYLEGNYASGTKNPAGRDWNTFDSLYPSNHDKEGFADQVGRRNLVQFRVGVEENLSKKWRIRQSFEGFWLATSHDNFYASSGAIAVPARPGASRHIGNELDLIAEYKMNKGLNFGFGYARLFAGQFLQTTTRGHDYQYPFAYMEYNFSKSGSQYGKAVESKPVGEYRW